MSISAARTEPVATSVSITDDALHVVLADGRELSVPLEWFPRLAKATRAEREAVELHAGGRELRWEEIDEDISVPGLLGLPD
jgi:hypothetical protein